MGNEYKLSFKGSEVNERLGRIDKLALKSEIPTKVSQLTNDKEYLTQHQSLDGYAKDSDVSGQINTHNTSTTAHTDIRNSIKSLGNTVDNKADKSQGIFYIEGDASSSTDTTNKVATWIGSHDEITSYFNGLTILYKIITAGSTTTTLNINGLGAVTVVRNATTAISTSCPVDGVLMLTYTVDSDGTAYWKTADYDSNTKTSSGTSNKTGTKMYLVGAASQTSSGTTTYTNSKCYIGTDNRLYSNGTVVPNTDDINSLIDAKLSQIPNASGVNF